MANEMNKPTCMTCGGSGWVGGPSFYAPDEGGEECPDCASRDPSPASPDAGAGEPSEHIGKLDPKFAHRLTCQRCKAQTGQVLRQDSDFFDCLECGSFTYVKGVNQQAHQRAAPASALEAPEQQGDAVDAAALRMAFLHSTNTDADGYEWGVAKVKFGADGKVESFLWGAADGSDLDAAMPLHLRPAVVAAESAAGGVLAAGALAPATGKVGAVDAIPHGWRIEREPRNVLALHRKGTAQPHRFSPGEAVHSLLLDLLGGCPECGGRLEFEEGEAWDGPSVGCVECGTTLATPAPTVQAETGELREAARQFHNLTQGDPEVIIRPPSAEKRDAIVSAGERLRAALTAVQADTKGGV